MQNFEQTSPELRALTDAELDEISGARSWLGRVVDTIKKIFDGPGDLRRSTDRPN